MKNKTKILIIICGIVFSLLVYGTFSIFSPVTFYEKVRFFIVMFVAVPVEAIIVCAGYLYFEGEKK